ncbi:MAG: PQQ-like beta-propeller repeat protein [Planctomycetes bacterium]|nr:PQQ-like beta-propeller repeat protein [Planctomycetota bacterium]
MNRRAALGTLVWVTTLTVVTPALAEDWPAWRGPRGDGTSRESGVPTTWSGTENVIWRTDVPGIGHASPIVVGDRIFTVSCLETPGPSSGQPSSERRPPGPPKPQPEAKAADQDATAEKPPQTAVDRVLLCYDRRDGKLVWQQKVISTPLEKMHHLNSHASSTPASDGKWVFAAFLENLSDDPQVNRGNITVAAYDLAGKQQWIARPGVFSSTHGFCSNPVLFENLVIINGDHDGDSYITALDKTSGKTVWKVMREHKTRSYCTPLVRTVDGRPQLILSGSKCVASYDPRSGEQIWMIDGPTEQFVASIVDNGKLLFMTCGFPDKHLLAIRKDGTGNITDTHIAWRTKENCSYVPSPVVVGNYVMMIADNGIASCFLAETGERMWKERIGRRFSASLFTAGGLAYFTSDDGETTVVRPGAEFEVVAKNELGEACYASAAIADGQLFLRGEKHLFCIGKPAGK